MSAGAAAVSSGPAFYAHLRVGRCDIAVPADAIVQAVNLRRHGSATALPCRDPSRRGALSGILQVDGRAVPLVSLERWLPLGEVRDADDQEAVLMQSGGSLIAVRADALMGVKAIAPSAIRKVCHDGSEDELFEAVAEPDRDRPLLCVLEVARLMKLASVWCEDAGLAGAKARGPKAALGNAASATAVRHLVCTVGDQLWALPARAVVRLLPTPPPELRLTGRRVCAIAGWEARKLPLVDLGCDHDQPGVTRPWTAVVVAGEQAIGLVVDRCDRLLDLADGDVLPSPNDELRSGTAAIAEQGNASVLDVDRLFAAVPEATISRLDAKSAGAGRSSYRPIEAAAAADEPDASGYLVFEADRTYASPAEGLIGVVALSRAAADDLAEGRRATVEWRGETLGVVHLPRIDGGKAAFAARLAVVVETRHGDERRRSAVAVGALTRWLRAGAASRSTMRMHPVGDVPVVTPKGSRRSESLVVVDLPQMAYLLD